MPTNSLSNTIVTAITMTILDLNHNYNGTFWELGRLSKSLSLSLSKIKHKSNFMLANSPVISAELAKLLETQRNKIL